MCPVLCYSWKWHLPGFLHHECQGFVPIGIISLPYLHLKANLRSSFLCLGWINVIQKHISVCMSITLEATGGDYFIGLLTYGLLWAVLYRNQRRDHFYEDSGSNCNCIGVLLSDSKGFSKIWTSELSSPSAHCRATALCNWVNGMGVIEGCCQLSEGSVNCGSHWNTGI